MNNRDISPTPKGMINMPISMVYELADQARSDETFWTAFKYEKDREGEPRVKLTLVKDLVRERLGEGHGTDVTMLLLMLGAHAENELTRQRIVVPSEAQVYEFLEFVKDENSYLQYHLENRGRFRDSYGRRANRIINEKRDKLMREFFKTDDIILSSILTQAIMEFIDSVRQ